MTEINPQALLMKLHLLASLFACLMLRAAGNEMAQLGFVRVAIPREEALAILGAKELQRLHFEYCKMSSNLGSCVFAYDSSESQEPSQCAVTSLEDTAPSWLGIMETPAYVVAISILNVDAEHKFFPDALGSIEVRVERKLCAVFASNTTFSKRTFGCDRIGETIFLGSWQAYGVMAICDIEVFGVPLKFPTTYGDDVIQPPKSCDAIIDKTQITCNEVIDNVTDSSKCFLTKFNSSSDYVEITYEPPAVINEIHVYSDNLTGLVAYVGDRICDFFYQSDPDHPRLWVVPCNMFGSFVKIYVNKDDDKGSRIQLCEVKALGHATSGLTQIKHTYLGCFKDVAEDRDLPMTMSGFDVFIEKCSRICKREGMKYFALQRGKICFCGATFGKHGRAADESACNSKCAYQQTNCGGLLHNSIYEIL